MKILGIDTSGYANAIGIVDGERVLADNTFEARSDSLEKIITHIDFVLKSAALTLDDIQGFGVGLGPGSWTGIRMGVTVAKILAYSTNRPLFGISTFEVLAFSAGNVPETVCAIISTGTPDTVYSAFYRRENGKLIRAGDYFVGTLQDLSKKIDKPVVLISSSESYKRDMIVSEPTSLAKIVRTIVESPKGSTIALLAANRHKNGEADDALSLTPLYLKESTARAFTNKYKQKAIASGKDI